MEEKQWRQKEEVEIGGGVVIISMAFFLANFKDLYVQKNMKFLIVFIYVCTHLFYQ